MDCIEAIKKRRSVYGIGKESPLTQKEIISLVEETLQHMPSAFNSQSSRVVILFAQKHEQLWTMVRSALAQIIPTENFASTEQKVQSFLNGFGTILFFDDVEVTTAYADKFASYSALFPSWADQSSGMLQFAIWTLLESKGLGVNLQHYNPLIDDTVKDAFALPKSWRLIAQMPFGEMTGEAKAKMIVPLEERLIIL